MLKEIDQRFPQGIAPLTLPWPSPRPQLPGILETIPPRRPKPKPRQLGIPGKNPPIRPSTSPHTPRIHILRGPRMARPPIKETRKEKKRKQRRRDVEQGGKGSTLITGVDASSSTGKTLLEKLFRTQAKRLRRLVTVLTTSASVTEIREVTLE